MALKNLLDWIVTDRFVIQPKITLPLTDVESGRLSVKDNMLFTYDATRTKWLSVQRNTLVFGRAGTTNNQYLNFAGGGISSKSGYRLLRNAVIVGMSVQTSNPKSYSVHLRRNDEETNIATIVSVSDGIIQTNTDRDVYANQYLQCYLEFTGTGFGVDDPIVMIELAWRG